MRADRVHILDDTPTTSFGQSDFGKVDTVMCGGNRRIRCQDGITSLLVQMRITNKLGDHEAGRDQHMLLAQ